MGSGRRWSKCEDISLVSAVKKELTNAGVTDKSPEALWNNILEFFLIEMVKGDSSAMPTIEGAKHRFEKMIYPACVQFNWLYTDAKRSIHQSSDSSFNVKETVLEKWSRLNSGAAFTFLSEWEILSTLPPSLLEHLNSTTSKSILPNSYKASVSSDQYEEFQREWDFMGSINKRNCQVAPMGEHQSVKKLETLLRLFEAYPGLYPKSEQEKALLQIGLPVVKSDRGNNFGEAKLSAQEIPIPARPTGFLYPNAATGAVKVQIEAYYDLLCPDSKAIHPNLLHVAEKFRNDLSLTVHVFPLPYHQNSMMFSSVAQVFKNEPYDFFKWTCFSFKNLGLFSTQSTASLNRNQIKQMIRTKAANEGFDSAKVLEGLNGTDFELKARVEWKVGAQRGVSGTPTIFVNGVKLDSSSLSWSRDEWCKFVCKLVQSNVSV